DGADVVNVTAAVVDNRTINASSVVFGNVIVGFTGSLASTLSTTGDDNTYTRVTVLGTGASADANGVSLNAGSSVQFDTDGESTTRTLTATFNTPGRKFGSFSLSRTGEGLAGEVVKPVTINYGALVRLHSDASFEEGANVDAMTINLGQLDITGASGSLA